MADTRVPAIFCVDLESDLKVFSPDDPSPFLGVEGWDQRSRRLREQLEQATGAPVQFLWSLRMDPQIAQAYGSHTWMAEHFRPFLDRLQGLGDVVGIHPHASIWDPSTASGLVDHADDQWVSECVATSLDAYRGAYGHAPPFHRFGSRFMTTAVMNQVRADGVPFDLSLEPGEPAAPPGQRSGATYTGSLPDATSVPRGAYQPDPSDFSRPAAHPDAEPFWSIPLASGSFRPSAVRPTAVQRLRNPMRNVRALKARIGGSATRPPVESATLRDPSHRVLTLTLPWRHPTDLWDSVFASIGEIDPPILAFAVRSDLLLHPELATRFEAVIHALERDPRSRSLHFTTPEQATAGVRLHT